MKVKSLILEKQSNSTKSHYALAAANIRRELKYNFPKTRFSVKSSSYSGGSSIKVYWVDGENSKLIDSIIDKYQYGHFDGMIDSYENTKNFNSEFGEAKYIFSNRNYSHNAYIEAVKNAVLMDGEELGLLYHNKEAVGFDTMEIECSERAYLKMRDRDYNTDPIKETK